MEVCETFLAGKLKETILGGVLLIEVPMERIEVVIKGW